MRYRVRTYAEVLRPPRVDSLMEPFKKVGLKKLIAAKMYMYAKFAIPDWNVAQKAPMVVIGEAAPALDRAPLPAPQQHASTLCANALRQCYRAQVLGSASASYIYIGLSRAQLNS